jgi:hypothetical protein
MHSEPATDEEKEVHVRTHEHPEAEETAGTQDTHIYSDTEDTYTAQPSPASPLHTPLHAKTDGNSSAPEDAKASISPDSARHPRQDVHIKKIEVDIAVHQENRSRYRAP